MPKTLSTMIPLGTLAPDFNLIDLRTNQKVSYAKLKSDKATVVMFICNHCPYVIHIQDKLAEVAHFYQTKGVHFIAINSNDAEQYPEDSPEKMHEQLLQHHFTFPYLHDETQEVARAYQAACTPDFYIFDSTQKCVYRGRFDESNPGNQKPVTGIELTQALDCLLSGKPIDQNQKPSLGCNIKWKKTYA